MSDNDDEMWSLSQAIDHVQKSLGCDRETAWLELRKKLIAGEITAVGVPAPPKSPWAPETADARKGDGDGYRDIRIKRFPASDTPACGQSPPSVTAPRSR